MREVVGGVVFTAKGRSGVERVHRVLTSVSMRIISVGRTKVRTSVMRGNSAFRRGTIVGTGAVYRLAKRVALTSSSNLRVSCLGGRPNVCSTHCVKRSASCRVGGTDLVRELGKIPSRGHATEFMYTITTTFPSKDMGAIHKAVRNHVNCRRGKRGNFNCSPVFCLPRCKYASTRLSNRRGGGVDREKGTLHTVGSRLG